MLQWQTYVTVCEPVWENEPMCSHIASLRKLLQNSNVRVDWLRKENKAFKENNIRVSLIVSTYQMEMKTKLDALQASGEWLEVEQKRLVVNILSASNPKPWTTCALSFPTFYLMLLLFLFLLFNEKFSIFNLFYI